MIIKHRDQAWRSGNAISKIPPRETPAGHKTKQNYPSINMTWNQPVNLAALWILAEKIWVRPNIN